jgi:hypothetical protein
MAELISTVNWLAVIVATLLYFFLGALWYSPVLFAKKWMELRNISENDIDGPNPVIFIYSFLLQFIAVSSLALFITVMGVESAVHGALVGFGAGAGILFSLAGTTGIFTELKIQLHFLDSGYHVIGLTIAGIILGLW